MTRILLWKLLGVRFGVYFVWKARTHRPLYLSECGMTVFEWGCLLAEVY